jgi:hypothetical protein
MVETPGATAAFTVSKTCRTIRPARRIFSISPPDLQTIAMLYRPEYIRGHFLYRLVAIDL